MEVSVIFAFRDQPLMTLESLTTLIRLSNELNSIEFLLIDIASSKVYSNHFTCQSPQRPSVTHTHGTHQN